MNLEQKIFDTLKLPLQEKEVDLVKVSMQGSGVVVIMIEKPGYNSISISECSKTHRFISMFLEAEGIDIGNYSLEVGSPGIERPLVKIEDYKHFLNKKVKIKFLDEVENVSKCECVISEVSDSKITFSSDHLGLLVSDFSNIASAKLCAEIKF